ncbi:MAG TPA: rod shape-determining protein MreC [Abditibacteriaceae bacterium]|jgi:rod shape-determining protein MreC
MRRSSPVVLLVFLLALCAFVVAWSRLSRSRGGQAAPAGAVQATLQWPQRAVLAVGDWAGDVGRTLFRRGGTVADNDRLRREVEGLRAQSQRLARYERENRELRALLQMPKTGGGVIRSAAVVSLNATDYARSITLGIGSRSGVREKDAVFTPQGAIGQVDSVGPFTCNVKLLTDRAAGVGAMVGRTAARGVVKGTGEGLCRLSYLDFRADVREGDVVFTSGDSQIFPRGLVIGRVTKVERDKNYSQLTAWVDPAVSFDRLSVVAVRTGANS